MGGVNRGVDSQGIQSEGWVSERRKSLPESVPGVHVGGRVGWSMGRGGQQQEARLQAVM